MRNFDTLMMIWLEILIFFTLRRGVFTNIFRGAARRGGRRAPRKVSPRGLATLVYSMAPDDFLTFFLIVVHLSASVCIRNKVCRLLADFRPLYMLHTISFSNLVKTSSGHLDNPLLLFFLIQTREPWFLFWQYLEIKKNLVILQTTQQSYTIPLYLTLSRWIFRTSCKSWLKQTVSQQHNSLRAKHTNMTANDRATVFTLLFFEFIFFELNSHAAFTLRTISANSPNYRIKSTSRRRISITLFKTV